MRALVFEPNFGGHYLKNAGVLARSLTEVATEVTLATSAVARHTAAYEEHVGATCVGVTVDAWMPDPRGYGRLRWAFANLAALRESIVRARAEHVYVPTADGLAQALGLLRALGGRIVAPGIPLEGLYLNGRVAHGGGVRSVLSYDLVKRAGWARLFHLNPFVLEWERSRGVPPNRQVAVLPEPIEKPLGIDKSEARRRLSLPEDGRYVGLMGRLDTRKGTDLLVEAFVRAAPRRSDRLLLLGPLDDAVRETLRSVAAHWLQDGRIIVRDAFVSDEEMLAGFAAVDLVAAPYRATGSSSGIITRAAAAERPVLGRRKGWMGRMIDRFSLGWGLDDLRPDTIAAALTEALTAAESWVLGDAGKRLNRFNTERNYALHWCALLRERCGQPAPEPVISWDWVSESTGQHRS